MLIPCNIYKIQYNKEMNNYILSIKNNIDLRLFLVYINSSEAKNISLAKGNVSSKRLSPYLLLLNLITLSSLNINKIVINKRKDVLFSQIYVKSKNSKYILDSNIIDSIIISLKTYTQIYIDDKLFDIKNENFIENENNIPFNNKLNKIETINILQDSLKELIDKENYESAAIVRDRIKSIIKK